jgi:alkanesulfonate monooxygenase SsuD/methylene tetrahydromethanopterin reductase-like flavin-dependent oxidoreductase (luciferase family)
MMISRVLWVSYPDRNFVRRAGLEVPADVEALIAERDMKHLPEIVQRLPDAFVEAFTWSGTPEMVAGRVAAVAQATGIEEFGFWMLLAEGQSRKEALQLLAAEVLPRLRALAPVAGS